MVHEVRIATFADRGHATQLQEVKRNPKRENRGLRQISECYPAELLYRSGSAFRWLVVKHNGAGTERFGLYKLQKPHIAYVFK